MSDKNVAVHFVILDIHMLAAMKSELPFTGGAHAGDAAPAAQAAANAA